jgi:hypothetical protein
MYQLVGALLICFLGLSFFMFMVSFVFDALKLILLWIPGAKDLHELGTRFDAHHAEWMKNQIARGRPITLGGVYKLVGRRIWTAYRHPIRAWRGEFDPPKKDVCGTDGDDQQ